MAGSSASHSSRHGLDLFWGWESGLRRTLIKVTVIIYLDKPIYTTCLLQIALSNDNKTLNNKGASKQNNFKYNLEYRVFKNHCALKTPQCLLNI